MLDILFAGQLVYNFILGKISLSIPTQEGDGIWTFVSPASLGKS